jgi:hypothetical protein
MNSTKRTPTAQSSTVQVAATPQGTPGQPARATQAIPAAQRQQAYRQRSKRAVTQAIGEETRASRVTLLALLGRELALLDDETAKSLHSAVRNSVRRVMTALVTRYEINLAGDPADQR